MKKKYIAAYESGYVKTDKQKLSHILFWQTLLLWIRRFKLSGYDIS